MRAFSALWLVALLCAVSSRGASIIDTSILDTKLASNAAEFHSVASPCGEFQTKSERIRSSSCLGTGSHPGSKSHRDVASVHCCSPWISPEPLVCSARPKWGEVSYSQAVAACASTGDRLCTKAELQSTACATKESCTASTLHALSWTADECTRRHDRAPSMSLMQVDEIPEFAAAVDGCNSRGTQIVESVCLDTASMDLAMMAAVRCCSGPVGEAVACQSYCRELTPLIWDNLNISDANVTTFQIASQICEQQGQRLCDPVELVARDRNGNGTMDESVCCLTGCAGDDRVVWTAQDCSDTLGNNNGGGGAGLANLLVLGVPWWVFLIVAVVFLVCVIGIVVAVYTVKKRKTKREYNEAGDPYRSAEV